MFPVAPLACAEQDHALFLQEQVDLREAARPKSRLVFFGGHEQDNVAHARRARKMVAHQELSFGIHEIPNRLIQRRSMALVSKLVNGLNRLRRIESWQSGAPLNGAEICLDKL